MCVDCLNTAVIKLTTFQGLQYSYNNCVIYISVARILVVKKGINRLKRKFTGIPKANVFLCVCARLCAYLYVTVSNYYCYFFVAISYNVSLFLGIVCIL